MFYHHIRRNHVKDHLGYVDKDMPALNTTIVK